MPLPPDGTRQQLAMQHTGGSIARFKHLTEILLPALARDRHWPIRFDHCFKRICLDHAFQDVWYNHLRRPAEKHLAGEPLARAIACAESIMAAGLPTLRQRNEESLRFRGKPARASTQGSLSAASAANPPKFFKDK